MLKTLLLGLSRTPAVKKAVIAFPLTRRVVERFVAGETLDECLHVTRALADQGLLATIDFLGEDTTTAAQGDRVTDTYVELLDRLAAEPRSCTELDWVAKLQILEGYRRRDGLDWSDARLQLVDLQYADMTAGKGLARKLEARGSLKRLTNDAQITAAVQDAPVDTRAWFRGECLRRYPESVAAASWDSVVFDVAGRSSLQRVPTLDPLRGTKAHVGDLLDQCRTADELLGALTGK